LQKDSAVPEWGMLMLQDYFFQGYKESERFFWSAIGSATVYTNDVDMYATGVNNEHLNPAIQKSLLTKDTFQKVLNSLQNFYFSHNIPWVWVIEQHLISQNLIEKKSLELLDKSWAMYLDLSNSFEINATNGLIIRENNDDITDWGLSLCQAYQGHTEVSNQYLDVVDQYIQAKRKQAWSKANFHHFVGYLNMVPVSCLTLSTQDGRARIDDVGTAPEHQNKGFATQMVVYAMKKATEFGANFCFLEASQAGTGVYERIGFKRIFSNLYFKPDKYF
jgi:ribosomal protein S18 acetylase RimI-like enzyme